MIECGRCRRPTLDITLLDSARKKCLFLDSTVRALELGKVPIVPLRVETMVARGEGRERYSVLTARAVTTLGETLLACGPLSVV
jgi:16S rRNA (guanine527-N7)-methyltransferase